MSSARASPRRATAKPGYVFLNWTEGGTPVSKSPSYTFTLLIAPQSAGELCGRIHGLREFLVRPRRHGERRGWLRHRRHGHLGLQHPRLAINSPVGPKAGTRQQQQQAYSFTAVANRTLVANFVPIVSITNSTPGALGFIWPASATGWILQESPDLIPRVG